jgi:hypothetical protein
LLWCGVSRAAVRASENAKLLWHGENCVTVGPRNPRKPNDPVWPLCLY